MELNWSQNLVYGIISGLTEILPVSAQAHRLVLRKIFGSHNVPGITLLLIHIGIFLAVLISCQTQIQRIRRAKQLARIPKKKRRRPLDLVSLMDYNLLMSMLLPLLLAFILCHKVVQYENNIFLVSALLFVNGIILYIPQYLPGSNRDARTITRFQGLGIGLGAALSALPGISAIGAAVSVGQALGEDRKYGFRMALLMELGILIILIVLDALTIAEAGMVGFTFSLILKSLLAAAGAFGGTLLGIRAMGRLAENIGFAIFGYYCWAVAIFTLILALFA